MRNDTGVQYAVSVILPVYNVEPYIGRCIESLRAQTMTELEFIFVDDCSTDGSMAAVEAWTAQDQRVRILRNEENLGAGPSRNRGIVAARGEYLSFVDPDDYVSPDFYELLYAAATADGGHDIAKGLQVGVDGAGNMNRTPGEQANARIEREVGKLPLYRCFGHEHQAAVFHRGLFEDGEVRFGASRKSEDTTFLLRACYRTEDIVIEPRSEYYYLRREGSITNERNPRILDWELDANEERLRFFERHGFDEHGCAYLKSRIRFFISNCYLASCVNGMADPVTDDRVARLRNIVERDPELSPLRSDCLYKSLVEHRVPLPDVFFLPEEYRLSGALSWVDHIAVHQPADRGYSAECSQAIARVMQRLARKGDKAGFSEARRSIAQKLAKLPLLQRVALWLGIHRRLGMSARSRPEVRGA